MAPFPLGRDSDVQGYTKEDADQDRGDKAHHFSNCPDCPEIKKKIDRIFVALLGDDGLGMQNGLVYEVTALKANRSTADSWVGVVKPIAIAVVTSALTFVLSYSIFGHL